MHRAYKYMIGIGLMLFGLFVICFPEYDHPIYGHINFGKYHVLLGVASATIGAVYTHFLNRNRK